MILRHKEIIRAAIVALTTIVVIVFAIIISNDTHPLPIEPTDSAGLQHYEYQDQADSYLPAMAEQSGYVLRDHNGMLTVFTLEKPEEPYYETNVFVRTLRLHDQELLAIGITAKNRIELQQLLDDFTT